jgi:chromate transporter
VFLLAVFVAIGVARLPLAIVLLVAVPISLAVTIVMLRRAA